MYYLSNFEAALLWVEERYADLLDAAERRFMRDFAGLPAQSRALLVRLIMRRGELFRESKIVYPEIGDIHAAFDPLIALGWVEPEPSLSVADLFTLLTRAELARIFELLRSPLRKQDALTVLREQHAEARTWAAWRAGSGADGRPERSYRVVAATLCARFRILFFGNFRQEWSEFVLADLGVFRYEKVGFSADSRAFRSRKDIDDLYVLYDCRRDFYDQAPPSEILRRLPRAPLDNEWLEGRRAKLMFQLAQAFERAGDAAAAMELYAESTHPGSRLRLIRLLELAGRHDEARAATDLALGNPQGDAERQKLFRFQQRLSRRSSRRGTTPATDDAPTVERLDFVLREPESGTSVEFAVLAHLESPGCRVFYVENALINSLFGLLFWDAIFAAVRGAFFHPFQSAPSDLYSPTFRERRAAQFDRGFAALAAGTYADIIRGRFQEKQGIQSAFVFWGALNETLLELALDCIPAAHLQRCFERLLANIRENRSGLPDLIQFWPAERRYRMIEVKGPGDRVQDNQRRWMDYCARHKIPILVCHARWADLRRERTFIQ